MVRRPASPDGGATPWTFHLSGGRLCLDLANTVSWRRSDRPIERLGSYADLLAWSRQTGLVPEADARTLAREATRRSAEAARVLAQAIALREVIYRIFSAIAGSGAPAPADLAALNGALAGAFTRLRITPAAGRFALEWDAGRPAFDRMLWPAARSAAELLVSDDLAHVRTCPAENCGWVFVDTTKNRSRRWCDMKVCGNRAKVRRHYARAVARRSPRRPGEPNPSADVRLEAAPPGAAGRGRAPVAGPAPARARRRDGSAGGPRPRGPAGSG
jgi:predicted RNA-binding Zn ribbon-like protein